MKKKYIFLGVMVILGILIGLSYPVFHVSLQTAKTFLYLYLIVILAVNAVKSFREKKMASAVMNLLPILLALWFMTRQYM